MVYGIVIDFIACTDCGACGAIIGPHFREEVETNGVLLISGSRLAGPEGDLIHQVMKICHAIAMVPL